MTTSPTGGRGRHAKPPSEISTKFDQMLGATQVQRRRLVAAGAGAGLVAALAVAAAVGLQGSGSAKAPKEAAAAAQKLPAPAATTPSEPPVDALTADPDEVPGAMAYFKTKDPADKVAKHVKEVRKSGPFLRVYTDLKEGDENSSPAISLCEWTTEFLTTKEGDTQPRVFVHGTSSDNGMVVLANRQSDKDDCKVDDSTQ